MTERVNYVDAIFDGKKRRFELQRDHIAAFEAALGDSAYAAMKRFINEEWRLKDVELTLSFAIAGATKTEQQLAKMLAIMPAASGAAPAMHNTHHSVSRVLREYGPAPYAELAMNVLIAALMGLPAEEAVFDDGTLEPAE